MCVIGQRASSTLERQEARKHAYAWSNKGNKDGAQHTAASSRKRRRLRAQDLPCSAMPLAGKPFRSGAARVAPARSSLAIFVCSLCYLLLCLHAEASGMSLSLMYNFGGCESNLYTAESYYVTPIVKDIYKNGSVQIIFANYSIIVTDATGKTIWRANGGYDRSKPYASTGGDVGHVNKIAVADIDGDGYDEIIAVHGNGTVTALSHDGYMKPGWPAKLRFESGANVSAAVNSLVVSDLDGDGKCEIIVGAGTDCMECAWVYRHNGELMPGWPQLSLQRGTSYGVFMDGIAVGDITGNGISDILVATDTQYICAYDISGKAIPANPESFDGRVWGEVGLWEDYGRETSKGYYNWYLGWEPDSMGGSRADRYRGELGHSAVKVADIDNDGRNEVVVSAVMVDRFDDRAAGGDIVSSRYMSVFIFNSDRTRYAGWEKAPSDRDFMAPPLVQDPSHMSYYVQAVPIIADLNNDGTNEILLNAYDGKLHAFSVTSPAKEFGQFPFTVPQNFGIAETPNEAIAVDINGDGENEVVFTTNTRAASGGGEPARKGSVYVLGSDGTLLMSTPLPDGYIIYETKLPAYTNASLAAPAVADIDGDGQYEIIVNTKYSGICVFKINGSTTKPFAPAAGAAGVAAGAAGEAGEAGAARNTGTAASNVVSPASGALTASPISSTVMLNGKHTVFGAYTINDNNYFKLRDLAISLSETKNRFDVSWDTASGSISLTSGKPYTPVGGEMAKAATGNKEPVPTSSKIYFDGKEIYCTVYTIDDNNYFKLRDIGEALGFVVDWDDKSSTIAINTA